MSRAQEIAIRVHDKKFPASKQDVALSIPMVCGVGKKRVVEVLQRLEEDVKRVYQHGEMDAAPVGILKLSRLPGRILLCDHELTSLVGEKGKLVFRSLKFHAKLQDIRVKREAVLKMRHTQFWDKGLKVHSVRCSLFRNDMNVLETLFSLDCHIKSCRVKQSHSSARGI